MANPYQLIPVPNLTNPYSLWYVITTHLLTTQEAVWRGCGCSQLHNGCLQRSPKHPRGSLPFHMTDRKPSMFHSKKKKKRPKHKFTQAGGVCLPVQTKCSGSQFSACAFQPMHSAFCRADVLLHEVLGSHLPP